MRNLLHPSFKFFFLTVLFFLSFCITESKAQTINTYAVSSATLPNYTFGGYNVDVRPDGLGNVYIADPSGNRILKINSSGTETVFVSGLSTGWNADGIFLTTDPSGNLYISSYDDGKIYKYNSAGAPQPFSITVSPYGIAYNTKTGYLDVSDGGNNLYELDASNGSLHNSMTIGGSFTYTFQIATDGNGNVYLVADNYKVYKAPYPFSTTSVVFAGSGLGTGSMGGATADFVDGTAATSAGLYSPGGVAADASGNVYISSINYNDVDLVNSSGNIYHYASVAAFGLPGSTGDGGPAISAKLSSPGGLGVNLTTGSVYIADQGNGKIRVVSPPCSLPSNPGSIVGNTHICTGQSGVVYSVASVSGATSYAWTLPTGGSFVGASTNNTITVNYSGGAVSGTVTVLPSNTCGNSASNSSLAISVNTALSGTYTIDNTIGASASNFTSFASAFAALKCGGITGATTFNVKAGITFPENPLFLAFSTNTPTATNTLTFQKSGAGANPQITSTANGGNPGTVGDAGILLEGVSYTTFDGIDIKDGGSNNATYLEYGYALINTNGASVVGCQHDVIKNCTVTLSPANNFNNGSDYLNNYNLYATTGVYQAYDDISLDNLNANTPLSAAGTNSNNQYYSNTIIGAAMGVMLYAYNSGTYHDVNNTVGVGGGNTILPCAGALTSANMVNALSVGIQTDNQFSLHIANNIITSGGTATSYNGTYGIYVGDNNATGNAVEIDHNTITLGGSVTGPTALAGIEFLGGSQSSLLIHDNTINTLSTFLPSGSDLSAVYMYLTTPTALSIYNNNISNSNIPTARFFGMNFSQVTCATTNIYNNTIANNSSGSAMEGIATSSPGTLTGGIYNNRIYSNSCGNANYGLFLGGNPVFSIYNNFISNLTTTSATYQVSGFYINTTSLLKLYYNSIYLNQTTSTINGSFAIQIFNGTSYPVDVRDNIVINTTSYGNTYALFLTGATAFQGYSASSNNNDYYVGTGSNNRYVFGRIGGSPTTYATLALFQAGLSGAGMSSTDNNSISANPGFTSQTDLHQPNMTNYGPIVAGVPISGFTTDIDGNTRSLTVPDIGADEFVCAVATTPTTPSGSPTRCFGSGTGVYTTSSSGAASYNWSVSGAGNSVSGTGSSATITWSATFTGVSTVSVTATNPCGTSPAGSTTVTVSGLNGTYTINSGVSGAANLYPNTTIFKKFSDAIGALTSCGLAGPVTFNVIAGLNYPENPLFLTITTNPPTAVNTLTFQKSGAGANPQITSTANGGSPGTVGDAAILLEGVSYTTFDGIDIKDGGNGESNYIEYGYALINTNGASVVGCQHDVIKNCTITLTPANNFNMGYNYLNNYNYYATTGIYQAYDNTSLNNIIANTPASAAGTNSNNQYYSNTIVGAAMGIMLFAYNSGTYHDVNNTVGVGGGNTILPCNGALNSTNMVNALSVGIQTDNQFSLHIANNIITSGGTATSYNGTYGIYVGDNNATGNAVEIDHNTITLGGSVTGPTALAGIEFLGGSQSSLLIHDNTINTLSTFLPSGSDLSAVYMYLTTPTALSIYNNNISNSNIPTARFFGMNFSQVTCATTNIYNNTIANNSSGSAMEGIATSSSPLTGGIYNNRIYSNSCGNANYGLFLAGNPVLSIYNNFISNLTTTSASYQVSGFYINTTSLLKLYYNSIYLNQTTSTINGSFAIQIFNGSSYPVDVRDNIVINTTNYGNAYALFLTGASAFQGYSASSNNNDYYVGTGSNNRYVFGRSSGSPATYTTLALFQAGLAGAGMSTTDNNSITVNPGFTSQTDLHQPNMTTYGPLVAGVPISGFTTDIDGNTRSLTVPDIGADEFVCAVATTPTTPSGSPTRCFGSGTGVYTTSSSGAASYNWSVSGAGNSVSGTGSSATITWSATFTGVSTVSVNATNQCGTSSTVSTTVTVGGLSGTYTINNSISGAPNLYPNTTTFNSFGSAISSLTSCGLFGPVTFNVVPGVPYAESPLTIAFTSNPPTATNTLTFVKAGGTNPLIRVTGTSNADVGLLINGVSYLTFDGIDISDVGTSSANYVETGIALARATRDLGCQHDTIRNCHISLNVNDDWTTNTLFNNGAFTPPASPNNFYTTVGIYQVDNFGNQIVGGLDAYPTSIPGTHQYNAFYSNTILNVGVGIALLGNSGYYSSPAGYHFYDGNNTIGVGGANVITAGTANAGGEAYGIFISDQTSFRAANNIITASDNSTDWVYGIEVSDYTIIGTNVEEIDHNQVTIASTGGTSETYGIRCVGGPETSVSLHDNILNNSNVSGTPLILISAGSSAITQNIYNNTINNNTADGEIRGIEFGGGTTANIYNNKVYSNNTTGSAGKVSAIYNNGGSVTANISNNFMADLKANTGTNVYGINLTTTTHAKLYYNSIYLNQTANISSGLNTIGIYIGNSTAATDVDVRNNLVINTSTPGTGSGGRTIALSLAGINTSSPKFLGYAAASDYNDYYAGTPGAKNLIFYSATGAVSDQALAGGFQTRIAARDAHSISVNPLFTSTTDLHKTNMTYPAYLYLIAGQPIAGYTTDIDGDLRDAATPDMGADEFIACEPSLAGAITGAATVCQNDVEVVYSVGTISGATSYNWTLPAGGIIVSGATSNIITVDFSAIASSGNVMVSGANVCGNGLSSSFAITVKPIPAVVVTPNNAVCTGGTSATLVASGGVSYTWSPTSNLTPSNGTSATETAQISLLTIYTVTGTGTNGCTANTVVPVATVAVGGTISPIYSIICSGGTKPLTVSGAAGNYYQWQISSNNTNWSDISGATNTTYTTNTTDGNTNKYYRLQAQSNSCWNVASTTAEVDVSQPTINVTTSALTDNSVTLNWAPIGSGNYTINYTGASTGTVLGTTPPKTLNGLTANGNYTITLNQTGAGLGTCPASGTATVTTLCPAPTAVTIISTGTNSITLTWTGGAGNYRVYYRPLYVNNGYFTKDVIGGTSTSLTKQGSNSLYHSLTYEIYVTSLDCPGTGNTGQPSAKVYATTTPALACAAPVIDSVKSACPVQLEVFMHGSPTNQYFIDVERLTPTIQPVQSFPVTGSYFTANVSAGQNYLITARSRCGIAVSNLTLWPGALQVKPQCGTLNNLLLSNPTCNGFTASWNADQCLANNASYYELYIRQVGTLNWNGYGVIIPTYPIGPYKLVNWLPRGKSYDVYAKAVYSCNGYLTYGATTQTTRITTLSAGCREEASNEEQLKPITQQTSPDNSEVFTLYPNPNSGKFTVDLSRLNTNEDAVRIEVTNILGQTVITQLTSISDGHLTEFINMPASATSGTYIVRVTAGKNVYTSKMNISK